MNVRFQLDEHISNAVMRGLRRRGIDVQTMHEADIRGFSDVALLAYCHQERRVIVTDDAHFLELHYTGARHAGIVYCPEGARAIGDVIRALELIHDAYTAEDMLLHLEYL